MHIRIPILICEVKENAGSILWPGARMPSMFPFARALAAACMQLALASAQAQGSIKIGEINSCRSFPAFLEL